MSSVILRARLILYLFFFFLDLSSYYVIHILPVLWSFILFLLILCGVGLNIKTVQARIYEQQITQVELQTKTPHENIVFTRNDLEKKLDEYQRILQIQPEHRDILINVSLLERAIHNQKDSYIYWEEAQKLDPNNEIFSTNSTK
jgi:hypothetical protein